MAAGTGNKMRLYCFVLILIGRKIDESSNVAEFLSILPPLRKSSRCVWCAGLFQNQLNHVTAFINHSAKWYKHKTIESHFVASAPYTPGRFPEWRKN